jgi:hypothetical protein
MHAAANKAVRVGRATALAVGVGVMLALVLGVATVALAAVPGDPFKLGRVNVISNATTALRGSGPSGPGLAPLLEVKRDGGGSGPALRVENTSTGLIGGDGIEVKVGPGKEPISVNPDAGKANLNVDRLDGKTEEDFLSASRVYSKTALKTGPGGGGAVNFTALDGSQGLACDEGDVALWAGATAGGETDFLQSVIPASSRSFAAIIRDNDEPNNHRATVVCSDSSKPFRD